ncbi:MAG: ribosome recycling factor [Candidatus Paceibacterota bacterium]
MDIIKDLETKIDGAIQYFKEQLAGIRGGRPTPKLVEDIPVDYLEQKLTVKQLGSISIVPPREIQISVWDKQGVANVVKAIESSSLSITANIEGNLIRINLPPLSQERRLELVKIVKKEAEETKIKIRSFRDETNKKISHQLEQGEINEDDKFRLKEEAQKLVDKSNEEVERVLENKIKEIEE